MIELAAMTDGPGALLLAAGLVLMHAGFVRPASAATTVIAHAGAIGAALAAASAAALEVPGAGAPFAWPLVAAVILAGALCERAGPWAVALFALLVAGVALPIAFPHVPKAALSAVGGAAVHVTAGAAAFGALVLLPARGGRFERGASGVLWPKPASAGAIPVAFAGLVLALGGIASLRGGAPDLLLCAGAGVLAAMLFHQLTRSRIDSTAALNGALSAAIAALALPESGGPAMLVIGAAAGLAATLLIAMLEFLGTDDPAGVTGAHLGGGLTGAAFVAASLPDTAAPLAALAAAALLCGAAFALALSVTVGLRAPRAALAHGLDAYVLASSSSAVSSASEPAPAFRRSAGSTLFRAERAQPRNRPLTVTQSRVRKDGRGRARRLP